MRDRKHWLLGAAAIVCLAQLAGVPPVAAQTHTYGPSYTRVRSEDQFMAGLVAQASLGSSTFRGLLEEIEATNGIVYVDWGTCGHGVRACLQMWLLASGGNRFLRVLIDRRRSDSDVDLMGSVGHELQHAVEALSNVAVVDGTTLYNFFRRYVPTDKSRFETRAAIEAGDAVRYELRQQMSRHRDR